MYQHELNLLGYTEKWLSSGILSSERLLREVKHFQSPSGDLYTEHYRAMTLSDFLSQADGLTNQEINSYLQLAYADKDGTMAHTAVLALLECPILTDEQFEILQHHSVVQLFKTSRVYSRQKLLRAIDREGVTPEVIDECLDKGDNKVHRRLLEFELGREVLEALTINGANKAIRNIAQQRLKQLANVC